MNRIKLTLLSFLWISMLPAMDDSQPQKKRIKLDAEGETIQVLGNLSVLPRDVLGEIQKQLLLLVTCAQSEKELKEAMQAISRLKQTCRFWRVFLEDQAIKDALKNKLKELGFSDFKRAIEKNALLFVIKALIYVGADVNKWKDKSGLLIERPLVTAAVKNRTDVIEALLDAGADIEGTYLGKTPLCHAAEHGNEKATELLLARGANVKASNVHRVTSLHWVAGHGQSKTVAMLIQAGARVNVRDRKGLSPLDYAGSSGNQETIQLIRDAIVSENLKITAYKK